jgi:hypothetical protein
MNFTIYECPMGYYWQASDGHCWATSMPYARKSDALRGFRRFRARMVAL